MKLVELVRKNCSLLGKLAYDPNSFGWKWIEGGADLPRLRGVYFLVSIYGIEKVGSARGRCGIRQRFFNYTRKYDQLNSSDPTNVLWHSMMSSCLLGEEISVYYMEVPDEEMRVISTPIGSFSSKVNVTLNVESHFFKTAMEEKEPMRLCGKAP